MQSLLKVILKSVGLYEGARTLNRNVRRHLRLRRTDQEELLAWRRSGGAMPAPAGFKREVLRKYAREWQLSLLVETGTFLGDTPFALRNEFDDIHSIELSPQMYDLARMGLGHLKNVHLYKGDSAELLPAIASTLMAPALFWLDGHHCFGKQPVTSKHTPILDEVTHLYLRPTGRNVILIDDARLFDGTNDYPTIEQLRKLTSHYRPDASFIIADDIIRIYPV